MKLRDLQAGDPIDVARLTGGRARAVVHELDLARGVVLYRRLKAGKTDPIAANLRRQVEWAFPSDVSKPERRLPEPAATYAEEPTP